MYKTSIVLSSMPPRNSLLRLIFMNLLHKRTSKTHREYSRNVRSVDLQIRKRVIFDALATLLWCWFLCCSSLYSTNCNKTSQCLSWPIRFWTVKIPLESIAYFWRNAGINKQTNAQMDRNSKKLIFGVEHIYIWYIPGGFLQISTMYRYCFLII